MSGVHFDQINIARDWFEFGKNGNFPNQTDDDTAKVITQFVAYWVAFNSIYSVDMDQPDEKIRSKMKLTERKQIEDCINNYYENCFKDAIDFNAEYINIFKEVLVFKGVKIPEKNKKYYNIHYLTLNDGNSSDEIKLNALVQIIYQVRCNVFHGSKSPQPGRNYNLVKNSNIVLEKLLSAYIKHKT